MDNYVANWHMFLSLSLSLLQMRKKEIELCNATATATNNSSNMTTTSTSTNTTNPTTNNSTTQTTYGHDLYTMVSSRTKTKKSSVRKVKKSTDLHQQKKNVAFGPNQHARHMQQHNRCNRSLRFFLVFVFAPINQSISPIHIAHMPCQSPWRMLIFSACSQLYFLHSWHLSPFIWIEINANIYYKTIQIENNAATICNIFLVFVILIFRLTAFLRHIESAISREPKQRP